MPRARFVRCQVVDCRRCLPGSCRRRGRSFPWMRSSMPFGPTRFRMHRTRRCRPRCSGCASGWAFAVLPPLRRAPRAMRSSWARRPSTRSSSSEPFALRSGQKRRSPARSCVTRCPSGGAHRTPVSRMSTRCVRNRLGWRRSISKRSMHTRKRCWPVGCRGAPSRSWTRSCRSTRCAPMHKRP